MRYIVFPLGENTIAMCALGKALLHVSGDGNTSSILFLIMMNGAMASEVWEVCGFKVTVLALECHVSKSKHVEGGTCRHRLITNVCGNNGCGMIGGVGEVIEHHL